jgi:hypothetical protein
VDLAAGAGGGVTRERDGGGGGLLECAGLDLGDDEDVGHVLAPSPLERELR